MSTVSEIQQAILTLTDDDYVQLRQWFGELDWKKWDAQIAADSGSGGLDFLVDQARQAGSEGSIRDL